MEREEEVGRSFLLDEWETRCESFISCFLDRPTGVSIVGIEIVGDRWKFGQLSWLTKSESEGLVLI